MFLPLFTVRCLLNRTMTYSGRSKGVDFIYSGPCRLGCCHPGQALACEACVKGFEIPVVATSSSSISSSKCRFVYVGAPRLVFQVRVAEIIFSLKTFCSITTNIQVWPLERCEGGADGFGALPICTRREKLRYPCPPMEWSSYLRNRSCKTCE
jgi:hypothetical protein